MNENTIVENAKNTIGYLEASNKKDFITGVQVGFFLVIKEYDKKIEYLENILKAEKSLSSQYHEDLKTLSSIIGKYLKED